MYFLSSDLKFSASNNLEKFWECDSMADFQPVRYTGETGRVQGELEGCRSGGHIQTVPPASLAVIAPYVSSHCGHREANGKLFPIAFAAF